MEVKNDYPPNYEEIKKVLNPPETVIFAHGDTIYNPSKAVITEDLKIHEGVHSVQQGNDPEKWWKEYLSNPKKRLEWETEAYAAQFRYFKDTPERFKKFVLGRMAMELSGEIYGNIISYGEAESKIRNYFKYQ
jgi:hypothetical protein